MLVCFNIQNLVRIIEICISTFYVLRLYKILEQVDSLSGHLRKQCNKHLTMSLNSVLIRQCISVSSSSLMLILLALWDFPGFITIFLKTYLLHFSFNIKANSEYLMALLHELLKLSFHNVWILRLLFWKDFICCYSQLIFLTKAITEKWIS